MSSEFDNPRIRGAQTITTLQAVEKAQCVTTCLASSTTGACGDLHGNQRRRRCCCAGGGHERRARTSRIGVSPRSQRARGPSYHVFHRPPVEHPRVLHPHPLSRPRRTSPALHRLHHWQEHLPMTTTRFCYREQQRAHGDLLVLPAGAARTRTRTSGYLEGKEAFNY